MVWSGYAVLMSGKTDSIKLNNISGCLRGSTFVYSEVLKLDFSSASHLVRVTIHPSSIIRNISWYRIFTKGQKSRQTGQNRARNRKEHEKTKPKANTSVTRQRIKGYDARLGKKERFEGQDEEFIPPHTRTTTSTPCAFSFLYK
ncbi:hypothetical protein Tco_1528244 [Tanacetum coccineum]